LRSYIKKPAKQKIKKDQKNDQIIETDNLINSLSNIEEQANNLAANGFFIEAMHTLLLNSLDEFKKILKKNFSIHLTSREILSELKINSSYTHFLTDIVTKVELSYFGTHLPGEEDYIVCRNSFNSLLKSLKQRESVV